MNAPHCSRLFVLLVCAGLAACGAQEPATTATNAEPAAVTAAPPEPLPPLRTGTREPAAAAALAGRLAGRMQDQGYEYLEVVLPTDAMAAGSFDSAPAHLDGAGPGDLALLDGGSVLVRRQLGRAATAPSGVLYTSSWSGRERAWQRHPFSSESADQVPDDATLKQRWLDAFGKREAGFGAATHPWYAFAAGRVQALRPGGLAAAAASAAQQGRPGRTELARLMETTTGALSMQEALQHDRGLRLAASAGPADIEISTLAGPPLVAHPFAAMQAQLPQPSGGSAEPLAAVVPAEFWYLRVDDIRLLLRLLDEADAWITPVLHVLQSSPEDRQLAQRYQAQLGLRRSGLAKVLGHTVVGQVALVGSDPYLREGSDLTLVFSVKQQAVFDAELVRHLEAHQAEVPGIASSTREYAGVAIQEHRDPAGIVRQQRAQLGDLALVSNSPRAIERLIDAHQGSTPRLADEADLQFMLARDPGQHQAFAFLSDRFIASVVGPAQKIQAARRHQALAELLVPGYAALLHGWLFGTAPASTEALLASGLLGADELRHADGSPIEFAPGAGAHSRWGTPAALLPLLDLPPLSQVTAAEKQAYEQFVAGYQQYWKQFIDPVAIRLDLLDAADGSSTARIDVRILPLISATDYSEIEAVVGNTRVEVPALPRGLQAVWAVGPEAPLRRELDGLLRNASGQQDIGLGWLGNWVALGLDDRASLVELYSRFEQDVQLPAPRSEVAELEDVDLWQRVGRFPIYAAAEVKNPVLLVATLTAIRAMLGQVAPGWIEWGEAGRHRELPIVRIGVSPTAPMLPNPELASAVALHYVQTGNAFVLALDVETLHAVIDRLLDGKAPQAGTAGSAQFVFETRSAPGRPLWTALLWLVQGQANNAQAGARRAAEILLRGDPALQADAGRYAGLALAYFGYIPVTARGTAEFELLPSGTGDAVGGTTLAPRYGELPIPGSPVALLMQRLAGLRGEIAFDREPAAAGPSARSLHTRFELQLGAPAAD